MFGFSFRKLGRAPRFLPRRWASTVRSTLISRRWLLFGRFVFCLFRRLFFFFLRNLGRVVHGARHSLFFHGAHGTLFLTNLDFLVLGTVEDQIESLALDNLG